jgi:hypothetical protein
MSTHTKEIPTFLREIMDDIAAEELEKDRLYGEAMNKRIAAKKAVEDAAKNAAQAKIDAEQARIDAEVAKIYAMPVWAQWCRKFWIVTGLECKRLYEQFDRV